MSWTELVTVNSISEIRHNIQTLSKYAFSKDESERDFYINLIKKGICFVVINKNNKLFYAPSKFVGYANNDINNYTPTQMSGLETNPAINMLLGYSPREDNEMEKSYYKFCNLFSFIPNAKGAFGKPRKYWRLNF